MNIIILILLLYKFHKSYGIKESIFTNISHSESKDWNQFSSILYKFYSHGEERLSYSAFEAFYDCTVGITQCYRNLSIISERAEIDCNSDHENNVTCKLLHSCVSFKDVLSLLEKNGSSDKYITKEDFETLLPIVTYQSQGQFCDHYDTSEVRSSPLPTTTEVWGYGILFVTLISSCSLAGVSVLPLMAKGYYQKLLTLLVGLAAGSLISSAVFHLIPQAFKITSNSNGAHSYLFVSLAVLVGIWLFFMIERFIAIILRTQKKKEPVNSNGQDLTKPVSHNESSNVRDLQLILDSQTQAIKASFGHEQKAEIIHNHEVQFRPGKDSVVATVAWMIIFGDGFHNFIDGVSIGAAFQQSILTGISISLAVMCEELPHELGDFAVLINSGLTMKQALFYNFLSATTCYLGMFVGIFLGEFTQDSSYIFAIAAGMFLYIALVDMFPEMRETADKSAKSGTKELIEVLILQNIGMISGVLILFFLAYYQDSISLE